MQPDQCTKISSGKYLLGSKMVFKNPPETLETEWAPVQVFSSIPRSPYTRWRGYRSGILIVRIIFPYLNTKGSAGTAFARFLPPSFQNGLGPRLASTTKPSLPLRNARTISNTVFVNTSENVGGLEPNFTHMTMLWGSYIDHDFTLTVSNQTEGCGTNDAPCPNNVPGCVSIPISQNNPDDRLRNNQSAQCIPLSRSEIRNGEQVCAFSYKI